jgi:hypothetical protein
VITPVHMFVNMDGRLRGLQFNQVATRVFHDCGGDPREYIVGIVKWRTSMGIKGGT